MITIDELCKKNKFSFVFHSLIEALPLLRSRLGITDASIVLRTLLPHFVSLTCRSKILPLGNAKKNKFSFVLRSLNRIFAERIRK